MLALQRWQACRRIEGEMAELTRRTFLTHASIGMAAGAVTGGLVAVPLGKDPLGPVETPTPVAPESVEGLIAHVRNLSTGEIALMVGTREVIRQDRSLTARLADHARSGES
jgi:hypothetical protein